MATKPSRAKQLALKNWKDQSAQIEAFAVQLYDAKTGKPEPLAFCHTSSVVEDFRDGVRVETWQEGSVNHALRLPVIVRFKNGELGMFHLINATTSPGGLAAFGDGYCEIDPGLARAVER